MSAPFLATITMLGGGGAQPKGGGSTHLVLITPVGGGHIDAGLPEGPPEHAWLPGHGGGPTDPGFGGGTPVPPEMWPPAGSVPPLPPNLESQMIVAVHRPGVTEWTVKAYPVPAPKA